ncbi:MAG TPA: sigma-70 family RNA polymerase sigma factor [Bryobacteraceae bacterium]|nr:sigma-70 family RNA polymerase sigma factor [Bryobacteraceae bacterium]
MSAVAPEVVALQSAAVRSHEFDHLVRSEQRRVFHICRNMLQDRDEADSATQDVFLKAYLAWDRDSGNLDAPAKWITRIAVNVCLDRLRSRRWKLWKRRPKPETEKLFLDGTSDKQPSAEDKLYASQIGMRIHQALDRLSERQRAVFVLRHYEDKTIEEISDILELEVGSVKSHMFRALDKLRNELRDLYVAGKPPLDR